MSRRDLARGGAVLAALVGVGTVATASPVNPDAELLGLSRQFLEIQAALEPLYAQFCAVPVEDLSELDRLASFEGALWDQQNVLADRVLVLQPRTQEGVAAKAGVARGLILRQHEPEVKAGTLPEEMAMVWSLLNDLVGRA